MSVNQPESFRSRWGPAIAMGVVGLVFFFAGYFIRVSQEAQVLSHMGFFAHR